MAKRIVSDHCCGLIIDVRAPALAIENHPAIAGDRSKVFQELCVHSASSPLLAHIVFSGIATACAHDLIHRPAEVFGDRWPAVFSDRDLFRPRTPACCPLVSLYVIIVIGRSA